MVLRAASPFMNTTIPSRLQPCSTPLSTVFSSSFSWKPLSLCFPTVKASPSVEKKATFASRRPGFYRDSNAEDNKFREATTSWWSPSSDDLDSDDEDEEEDDVFEQPWESFGIIKVFRAFGWMLPAIILSMLLATGPKAFLMAMALPLSQTALSFAVDKLWGKNQVNSRSKPRSRSPRSRPFSTSTTSSSNYANREHVTSEKKEKSEAGGDESWGPEGSCQGGQRRQRFGGWEDLENEPAAKPPPQKKVVPLNAQKKTKFVRRVGNREVPLLWRLLVAVFPFLGSWGKIF